MSSPKEPGHAKGNSGGWKAISRRLKDLKNVAREVHTVLTEDEAPAWAKLPSHVPRVPLDCDDVDEIALDLPTQTLAPGLSTLGRILSAMPDQAEADEKEAVRPIECWVALLDEGSVEVRIGEQQVCRVPADVEKAVGSAIQRFCGGGRGIVADGEVRGSDLFNVHLVLYVPSMR